MSTEEFLAAERRKNGGFVIFMENRNVAGTTGRGSALHSPQASAAGASRYELMKQVQPGDIVASWLNVLDVLASPLSGATSAPIDWAGRLAVPGYTVPLDGGATMTVPVTLEDIQRIGAEVTSVNESLKGEYRTIHPAFTSQSNGVRPTQGLYLSVIPHDLLQHLPLLREQVSHYQASRTRGDVITLEQVERILQNHGELYAADEQRTVRDGASSSTDGAQATQVNRLHAYWCNQLRRAVAARTPSRDGLGLVALPGVDADLAYRLRGRGRAVDTTVVEVKTIDEKNEHDQIGRGLGQLARYGGELDRHFNSHTRRVLFLSRAPRRYEWVDDLARHNVDLAWPGKWPAGLDRPETAGPPSPVEAVSF